MSQFDFEARLGPQYARRMPPKTRPRDPSQLAKAIVDLSVGDVTEPAESRKAASGRAGGIKGGRTRMGGLTEEQRVELAKKAAAARWKKGAADRPKKRSA